MERTGHLMRKEPMRHPWSSRLLPGVVAGVLLSGGCLVKNSTQPSRLTNDPRFWMPQDSAANCLTNMQKAYVNRDLDGYKALFASDFTFVLAYGPSTLPSPMPERWGMADESAAADEMFHGELVDRIDLSFGQDDAVDSGALYAGTWKVHLRDVKLQVYTRENGLPLILSVPRGSADIYFKSYPGEQASNGKPLWRVWLW